MESKAHQRIRLLLEKESLGQFDLLSFSDLGNGESGLRNVIMGVVCDNLIIATIEPSILEIKLPLVLKWSYYQENKVCKVE